MASKTVSSVKEISTTLRLMYQHAVESVNPFNLINNKLNVVGDELRVGSSSFNLNNVNCYLVGFGKAVLGMAYQSEIKLGHHLKKGIVSIPVGQRDTFKELKFSDNSAIQVFEGAKNNMPDEDSEKAAKEIAMLAKNLGSSDLLIVLVSGGGSALLPLPIPPVALQEKLDVIKLLQKSGANITELNCIRKKLSVLKGGGLLKLAYPAEVVSFILSDIVGDPLDFIASAPTVYNKDKPEMPKLILEKYSMIDKVPLVIKDVIVTENVNKADYSKVTNILIGTNRIALEAALDHIEKDNSCGIILTDSLQGLVSDIYLNYITLVLCICKVMYKRDVCESDFLDQTTCVKEGLGISNEVFKELIQIIYKTKKEKLFLLIGGEPTVEITGNGIGGRSQQLVLMFSCALNKIYDRNKWMSDFNVGLLCGGTDGMDGPTDAAGAVAYTGQMKIAEKENLDPDIYIKNNDSYTFYSKFNNGRDLLKVGHTGTNVMDIHLLVIEYFGRSRK